MTKILYHVISINDIYHNIVIFALNKLFIISMSMFDDIEISLKVTFITKTNTSFNNNKNT